MNSQSVPNVLIDRMTWERLVRGVKALASSSSGGRAKQYFATLIVLMLGINILNVVNSYVGRDFMTAIENRSMSGFIGWGGIYIGLFAGLTIVAVFYRYWEERLSLLWREWLASELVEHYLDKRVYYRLDAGDEIANPDQRITDDVKAFTATTLSFALMLLNSSFTVILFAGVLWSISPLLFVVAVLYSLGGSYCTFRLGRPLVGLNYSQLDREANFRADLLHVRENAESLALLHREKRLRARMIGHLQDLVGNFRQIINVNRNLGFFTTGYNYLIQVIPALLVAPMFIKGEVEFGVITQSAMAFTHLLGAFSLLITNFQSISSYAAVIARVGALSEAVNQGTPEGQSESNGDISAFASGGPDGITVCEDADYLAFENLNLLAAHDGAVLLENLSARIEPKHNVLIVGPNDAAKVALFRACAGIWERGSGRIVRPKAGDIFFLPERPYMPPGTLRELLVRSGDEDKVSDEVLTTLLRRLDLESLLVRAGGFDIEKDWDDLLSLGEQQLLACCRLLLAKPQFALLDRITTSLNPDDASLILRMMQESNITYITLGRSRHGRRDTDDRLDGYDAMLQLDEKGGWRWHAVVGGELVPQTEPA